jgi:hypothetical protein
MKKIVFIESENGKAIQKVVSAFDSGTTATEFLEYATSLMVAFGYHPDAIKEAIWELADQQDYEDTVEGSEEIPDDVKKELTSIMNKFGFSEVLSNPSILNGGAEVLGGKKNEPKRSKTN